VQAHRLLPLSELLVDTFVESKKRTREKRLSPR
jgi:hypothetical protein